MFTGNEDMEATALREQGWSISAIARHLGRNRETIRNHLNGTRRAGERRRSEPDPFEEYIPYLRARFTDDAHIWASALYDEVEALGFRLSYQSFTRGLRRYELRPHCEACAGVKGRATIEIPHPRGEEIQWDWDELPEAPWGDDGHLLLGSLPCSGKFRGVFAECEDQPHLIEAMDGVLRRLGGNARRWRFDRMATVVDPKSGIVQPSFVPVAKHYCASVVACPPRRGNRKGSVEKSIHFATQRFWRTMTAKTMPQAQDQLDRFCERIADRRPRPIAKLEELLGNDAAAALLASRGTKRPTVGDLAELEGLRPLPAAPYPAMIEATNKVGPSSLVAFEGNAYSVPPGLIGAEVTVRHRLGTDGIEIISSAGILLASHQRKTPGGGYVLRDPAHRASLEAEVLLAFTSDPPCRRKANRPPGETARAEAQKLLQSAENKDVVVSLAAYQALVEDMARHDGEVEA
ncbi:MAG: helix-turn-helix domain-containing protein [Actinomycetota bacterium]|jgi:transposase|nr:helix-turn-helix domain-containing protein [Actinomycetota bacterium]